MHLSAAKEQLCKCLEQNGVSFEHPDASLVWAAFRDFCRLGFEAPFSGCRFLAHVRASSKKDSYEVEMGRQFSDVPFQAPNWARGSSGRFYKVSVSLLYEPEDSLLIHIEQRFSLPGQSERDFLSTVEALPVFPTAFQIAKPRRYEIIDFGDTF
jgi:hypothetical protein